MEKPCDKCRKVTYCNEKHCSRYKRWRKSSPEKGFDNLANALSKMNGGSKDVGQNT